MEDHVFAPPRRVGHRRGNPVHELKGFPIEHVEFIFFGEERQLSCPHRADAPDRVHCFHSLLENHALLGKAPHAELAFSFSSRQPVCRLVGSEVRKAAADRKRDDGFVTEGIPPDGDFLGSRIQTNQSAAIFPVVSLPSGVEIPVGAEPHASCRPALMLVRDGADVPRVHVVPLIPRARWIVHGEVRAGIRGGVQFATDRYRAVHLAARIHHRTGVPHLPGSDFVRSDGLSVRWAAPDAVRTGRTGRVRSEEMKRSPGAFRRYSAELKTRASGRQREVILTADAQQATIPCCVENPAAAE